MNNLDKGYVAFGTISKTEQIIGEAYNNFVATVENNRPAGYTRKVLTQEEFVKNSIIDPYFSKHWGLKIEERELSLLERYELIKKLDNWVSVHYKEPKTMEYMDKLNIPTKLITLTYKDKTIESYE